MPQTQSAAYVDATQWLYNRIDYERLGKPGTNYRFTLDRMRELVDRLGHGGSLAGSTALTHQSNSPNQSAPPNQPKVIHLAGTKGKGSTASMIAAMLTASGFRAGLYTSPHLVRLEERFRVDGVPASEEQMVDLIESFKPIVDAMAREPIGGPSFFELTTAIAIEHFHRCRCDHWVLETGLGGRLDSTNVFQSDVTVITSIGLDHQHVLGDTVDKIAKEKAGIFKPSVPAISGVTEPLARDVIREHSQLVGAPLFEIDRDFEMQDCEPSEWGSHFLLTESSSPTPSLTGSPSGPPPGSLTGSPSGPPSGPLQVRLGLEGRHQAGNAALAIQAFRSLGLSVNADALSTLATLQIDARLEKFELNNGVTLVLDAAHNPDSIAALSDTVKRRFSDRHVTGVFGTSVDKDAPTMLGQLKTCFDAIVLTRYHRNPRFVPTAELEDTCQASSTDGDTAAPWWCVKEDPIEACRWAIEQSAGSADTPKTETPKTETFKSDKPNASKPNANKPDSDQPGVVVVCGSFFLAAEVRPWLVSLVR